MNGSASMPPIAGEAFAVEAFDTFLDDYLVDNILTHRGSRGEEPRAAPAAQSAQSLRPRSLTATEDNADANPSSSDSENVAGSACLGWMVVR
jgi:hypothetical protein